MVRRCNSVSVARLAGNVLSLLSATEHTLTFLKHSLIFGSVWQTQITHTHRRCMFHTSYKSYQKVKHCDGALSRSMFNSYSRSPADPGRTNQGTCNHQELHPAREVLRPCLMIDMAPATALGVFGLRRAVPLRDGTTCNHPVQVQHGPGCHTM